MYAGWIPCHEHRTIHSGEVRRVSRLPRAIIDGCIDRSDLIRLSESRLLPLLQSASATPRRYRNTGGHSVDLHPISHSRHAPAWLTDDPETKSLHVLRVLPA